MTLSDQQVSLVLQIEALANLAAQQKYHIKAIFLGKAITSETLIADSDGQVLFNDDLYWTVEAQDIQRIQKRSSILRLILYSEQAQIGQFLVSLQQLPQQFKRVPLQIIGQKILVQSIPVISFRVYVASDQMSEGVTESFEDEQSPYRLSIQLKSIRNIGLTDGAFVVQYKVPFTDQIMTSEQFQLAQHMTKKLVGVSAAVDLEELPQFEPLEISLLKLLYDDVNVREGFVSLDLTQIVKLSQTEDFKVELTASSGEVLAEILVAVSLQLFTDQTQDQSELFEYDLDEGLTLWKAQEIKEYKSGLCQFEMDYKKKLEYGWQQAVEQLSARDQKVLVDLDDSYKALRKFAAELELQLLQLEELNASTKLETDQLRAYYTSLNQDAADYGSRVKSEYQHQMKIKQATFSSLTSQVDVIEKEQKQMKSFLAQTELKILKYNDPVALDQVSQYVKKTKQAKMDNQKLLDSLSETELELTNYSEQIEELSHKKSYLIDQLQLVEAARQKNDGVLRRIQEELDQVTRDSMEVEQLRKIVIDLMPKS